MKTTTTTHKAPGRFARHLGALGFGLVMAIALLAPGAALAAPRNTTCSTVACVIAFGDHAIQLRLNSLATLSTKITNQQNLNHITNAQAGVLQSDVSTNQSGLNALKTKLDAETVIANARQDVRDIYTQFRIYIVVLPRDFNEVWLNILQNVQAKILAAEPKVQSAINSAAGLSDKDNDGDVAEMNAKFTDLQNQVTNAGNQLSAAASLEGSLTAANFDASPTAYKTNWDSFRDDIRVAHQDDQAAANDLHTITRIMQELIAEQNEAANSPATGEP
ncbi:MAG TPA: hypothetical protein VIC85_08715 [Ktedonobacterales bacterium]